MRKAQFLSPNMIIYKTDILTVIKGAIPLFEFARIWYFETYNQCFHVKCPHVCVCLGLGHGLGLQWSCGTRFSEKTSRDDR